MRSSANASTTASANLANTTKDSRRRQWLQDRSANASEQSKIYLDDALGKGVGWFVCFFFFFLDSPPPFQMNRTFFTPPSSLHLKKKETGLIVESQSIQKLNHE